MSIDSESELFVTQKAVLAAAGQLTFQKTTLNLYLRMQTTRKQWAISIYAPRNFLPTFLQWKAMNHRLRKSANVCQKKTLLSSILVIVASYLIFPNKHL